MNLRLVIASSYVPGFVKRRKLGELLCRTADAFGVAPPDLTGTSFRECLGLFAAFTRDQAENAYRNEAPTRTIHSRLRSTAYEFGKKIKHTLKIDSRADVMRAARLLYTMLGIDFDGGADGRILIRRCYFSDIYSPHVCALISALDEGMLMGLAGGGRLEFASRITEGSDCCRAIFYFEEKRP